MGSPRPAVVFPSCGTRIAEERASSIDHVPNYLGRRRGECGANRSTEPEERKPMNGKEEEEEVEEGKTTVYTASILDEGRMDERKGKEERRKEKGKEERRS